MRAWCLIRPQPVYRREAFCEGLARVGFDVRTDTPRDPHAGDVLLVWNRYGATEPLADAFEAAGGTVLVAENGYLDPDRHGRRSWYALARGGHNGQGEWPDGGPARWAAIAPRLGVEVQPWRTAGTHVLVVPSRSFGRRGHVMPADWAARTVAQLAGLTPRPIRVRAHPGNDAPAVPLADDLRDCWAVVTWYSSAAVHALIRGIPVICAAPAWIAKAACPGRLEDIEAPPLVERAPVLERLAWAQWHVEEIARGEPFAQLLPATGQGQVPRAAGSLRAR